MEYGSIVLGNNFDNINKLLLKSYKVNCVENDSMKTNS